MAMSTPRPAPKHVVISAEPSPPCILCASCKPSPNYPHTTTGLCLCPDNTQDSKGVIPEIVTGIDKPNGTCLSFIRRSITTRETA